MDKGIDIFPTKGRYNAVPPLEKGGLGGFCLIPRLLPGNEMQENYVVISSCLGVLVV